jgi:hypothetical protein
VAVHTPPHSNDTNFNPPDEPFSKIGFLLLASLVLLRCYGDEKSYRRNARVSALVTVLEEQVGSSDSDSSRARTLPGTEAFVRGVAACHHPGAYIATSPESTTSIGAEAGGSRLEDPVSLVFWVIEEEHQGEAGDKI